LGIPKEDTFALEEFPTKTLVLGDIVDRIFPLLPIWPSDREFEEGE
jgi:hypothetical protein